MAELVHQPHELPINPSSSCIGAPHSPNPRPDKMLTTPAEQAAAAAASAGSTPLPVAAITAWLRVG